MKVSINLVTWNGAKYINDCLQSLFAQTMTDFSILVIDNNSADDTVEIILEKYPHLKVVRHRENLGFSKAHNQAIHWSKSDYVVVLNQDVVLEPDFLAKTIEFLDEHPKVGSVTGKILRLQEGNKTKYIDSLGLQIKRNHCFSEIGSGELDEMQYDAIEEIFGVSGAIGIYRRSALESIKINNQFFDEDFSPVYKEDVDLAYRLRYQGWESYKVPSAIAYHDRTTAEPVKGKNKSIIRNRRRKSKFINYLSYRNHWYLLIKNLPIFNWHYFSPVFGYELLKFFYVLFLEPRTLKAWKMIYQNRQSLLAKRKIIMEQKKIDLIQIERWLK